MTKIPIHKVLEYGIEDIAYDHSISRYLKSSFQSIGKLLYIGLFFCVGTLGLTAQKKIATLLDSLESHDYFKVEYKIGDEEKSKKLLKNIDTSLQNRTQVDLVHEYYRLHTVKAEEYPFPFLLWTKTTSQNLGYTEGLLESLEQYGKNTAYVDWTASLSAYQEALSIYEDLGDREGVAHIKSRIGLWHFGRTKYVTALQFLFESLDIYKEIGNHAKMVSSYHNIADTYRHIKDTLNTVKYLKRSSDLEKEYQNAGIRAMNNNFLGEIYLEQGRFEAAIKHLNLSNAVIQETGELPYLFLYNLMHLGTIEEKMGHVQKAHQYYRKAFVQSYLIEGGPHIIFKVSTRLADTYIKLGQPYEAIALLTKIDQRNIRYSQSLNSENIFDFHEEFYQTLAKAYKNVGDYKNANRYTEKRIAIIDSINTVAVLKNATELEKKYQSKIDKQEIRLLKDQEEITSKNFMITTLILSTLALFLFLGILFYLQRVKSLKRKQALHEMALQNEQIRANNLEKEQEISQLQFALEQKKIVERIRHKISADLHDDVGSVLTGLSMQSELLENQLPKKERGKLHRISQLSKDAMLKMRDTVWALDSNKDTFEALMDRIKDFATENLSPKGVHFSYKSSGFEKEASLPSLVRQQMYLIAKEGIANIIKHSNASKASICLSLTKNILTMTIQDDGVLPDVSLPTSGLGLSNIEKRMAQLGGSVRFSTQNGFGIHLKVSLQEALP